MKRLVLILFMVFSLQNTVAQEFEMIRHQVQLGETVRMISRKYKIEPAEIYRLNKFAIDGISQGMVLQLLVPKKEPKETETVAENPSDDQQVAQNSDDTTTTTTTTKKVTTTVIRKKTATDDQPVTSNEGLSADAGTAGAAVTHKVQKGETLYSIARQHNVSVDDIQQQNEKVLKRGLQPGQILAIVKSDAGGEALQAGQPVQVSVEETTDSSSSSQTEVRHKVVKGETLFSLSRKYNVPVDDIKAQNETLLQKGLQVGQVLTIRTNN